MALIEWSDALSVGITQLDADHQHLASLINELHEAQEQHRGGAVLASIMVKLRHHVAEHFEREESLMEMAGYTEAADHAHQHATTVEKLAELETVAAAGNERAARTVLEFLKAWFVNHIVGNDMKLREVFREKGMADIPADEKQGLLRRIADHLDVLSLKKRIMLLVIIPLLIIVVGATVSIIDSMNRVTNQKYVLTLAGLSEVSSALIHEMQKERGASALFLGSNGTKFGTELAEQRKATDTRLSAFNLAARQALDKLPLAQGDLTKAALADLNALDEIRRSVDGQSLPTPKVIGYYTKSIAGQLAFVESMAQLASDTEMALDLVAYSAILNAKERAGQERAVGSAGFAAGAFSGPQHTRLIELIAEQRAFFQVFRKNTGVSLVSRLDAIANSDIERQVLAWRKVAVESPINGSISDVKAADWFAMTTQRIDDLKKVEDAAADKLEDHAEAALKSLESKVWQMGVFTIFVVAVTLAMSVLIITSVVPPFLSITATTKRLAEGERTVDVPGQALKDEVGDMARAVQFFKERLVSADLVSAEGWVDNQARIETMASKEKAIVNFDQRMTQFVGDVSAEAGQLMKSSSTMTEVVNETTSRSNEVAEAAADASHQVQSAAAATEELAASIREISRQVQNQAVSTREAVEDAQRTNVLVEGLLETASRIGDVVQMIQRIAAQTNLLALNATIEAARSGDAGKGFAVVAGEVKLLANQTAKATDEITSQIRSIQRATQESVIAIRGIVERINGINEVSTAVAAAVEEQEAATAEISRNVQDTAHGADRVRENISEVLNATGRADNAAQVVAEAANALGEHAKTLQRELQTFLISVRS